MRIFGINEASYYCSSFSPYRGLSERRPWHFFKNQLGGTNQILREGSTSFREWKSCSLRDVERCLFLAASHYRRFLDLLVASAAPWAHVTSYYGSFYSAHAILGLFGVTIFNKKVVDVNRSSPGRQELRIRSIGRGSAGHNSTYIGSHQRFWDLFYRCVVSLKPLVPRRLAYGLSPVSSNPTWQIEERNKINYDTASAVDTSVDFLTSFVPASFPISMPGSLTTQFRIFEALVEIAFKFSSHLSLQTDALERLGGPRELRKNVSEMVYNARTPSLVRKTKKSALI